MKLYQSNGSPNSRRIRILLAEKQLALPVVAVDLGSKEQHSDAYRAINPRRVVPTLVLDDGTSIGEVPAISHYIEDIHPEPPLLGRSAKERALVLMWERRIEQEGFASVMEALRNQLPGLKDRAIAGPHDYAQIPALVARGIQRVRNLFVDIDAVLASSTFVAGAEFSVADITLLATVDFAAKALDVQIDPGLSALRGWYERVTARPSATA
jgi:glutathione S-transferase